MNNWEAKEQLKEAARNVILLVGQFSTSSSRNGHSHPLARNACKEQTNSALLISNVNLIVNQGVN